MEDKNTRKLIKLYRRTNSEKAFRVLVVNHQNALHKIASKFPKNILQYDEIISYGNEFLIDAIKKKFDLRYKIKFITYLINKGYFFIIDKTRKFSNAQLNKERNKIEIKSNSEFDESYRAPAEDFISNIEDSELKTILEDQISKLPRDIQIVVGCVYSGYRQKDIAIQLDVSVSYISQLYSKGLKILKQKLKYAV